MKKIYLLCLFLIGKAHFASAQVNWIYSNNIVISSNWTDDSVFAHCDTALFRMVDDTLQIGFYMGHVGASCPIEFKYSPVVNDSMKVRFSWVQNPVCNMDDPEWCVTLKLLPCDSFSSMKVWLGLSLPYDDSLNGYWYQITKNPNCTITAGFAVGFSAFEWSVASALQNSIHWNTVDEKFIDHYEVQKSYDGHTFETFATVISQGDGSHNYRVSDPATQRLTYYRIKIIDRDKQIMYSTVKSIMPAGKQASISVFPNPAKSSCNIHFTHFDEKEIALTLSDIVGRVVYRRFVYVWQSDFTYPADLTNLPKGYYLLQCSTTENENELIVPLMIE